MPFNKAQRGLWYKGRGCTVLSYSLHKQCSLNIQHYTKSQVPLKTRTGQWGDFHNISSQIQSIRKTGSSCLEGQVHPLQKCQSSMENLWKGTWGKELQSEGSAQISYFPNRTQAPRPHRHIRGWEWRTLREKKPRKERSRRAWGIFLFKVQP